MTLFLIIGICMAVLSAIFWCIEGAPIFDNIKKLGYPKSKNPIKCMQESSKYIVNFLAAILSGWALYIDLLCTVWLSGAFGVSGVTGFVIGLSISNVISIFLIIKQKQTTTCSG